jgi:hypothetical protein
METISSFDPNQRTLNFSEILNGDASTKGGQNLQAITVYIYQKMFVLEPNKGTNIGKKLLIERQTGRISEIALQEKTPDNFEKKRSFTAFLGIINILDKAFLLMADDAVLVCNIEGCDVFQLGSTTFIPFESENELFSTQSGRESLNYIQNIRKLLAMGHYFSYNYNLTLSKMRQAASQQTEPKFAWNWYMYRDLLKFNVDRKWTIPLIQGYVGYFDVYLMGKKLEFFLISRRSCYKAGTRYNARGIDDSGNVANYCETEQIIYYNSYCCSYVEIRGSVPVFWQQRGLTTQTKITRSYELTNGAFVKHFDSVNNDYGRVLCVNLLAKGKSGEQLITETFEQHIRGNSLGTVRYEYFDFHHACKGQKFSKVNPLIQKLTSMLENFRFYAEDTVKKQILLTQKGIIRTNCLDCLDRTNVFQTKLAIVTFDAQMRQLGVDLVSTFGQDVLSQLDNDNPKQQHPFIMKFKNVWADNGDLISMHYAGTGSVISGVTRTGKRNFLGLLDHASKTLNRFYIGNFEDQIKQECIDILLGQHTETTNIFGEQFEKALKEREREFCTNDETKFFITTWNIGGFEPTASFDLSNLFNWEGNANPDIVVIGLQEFIPLNAKSFVVATNDNLINTWKTIIANNLKRFDKYNFVRERTLIGILTLVFAKESIKDRISKVEVDSVKTGLAGKLGNKGGVVIKMCIDDSSFAFINAHLEAGEGHNNSRLLNLIDIHQKAFQEEGVGKRREERIINLDYKFLLGDMNFRLSAPNLDVRRMLDNYHTLMGNNKPTQANQLITDLLKYDQLKNAKESSDILEKYQEGAITFLPTYKYDKYSNVYDSSKKQRTPSWTDRIMWSSDFGIVKQLFYNRREIKESDHRPVCGYFILDVKKVNATKKEEIIKQIYENDTNLRKAIEEEEARSQDPNLIAEDDILSTSNRNSNQNSNHADLI